MSRREFTDREIDLHLARVCVDEARIRRERGQSRMVTFLLNMAANARRRAGATPKAAQGDLFGSRPTQEDAP